MWWGTSKFDGQYDSFQSQGNRVRSTFIKRLKIMQPEIFVLTTRHPIERLLSGWNNILCRDNCRNEDRVKLGEVSNEKGFR